MKMTIMPVLWLACAAEVVTTTMAFLVRPLLPRCTTGLIERPVAFNKASMPITSTNTTRMVERVDVDDIVSRNTNLILETHEPGEPVEMSDDDDLDPAKHIFDPMSFWTERSGRFPTRNGRKGTGN